MVIANPKPETSLRPNLHLEYGEYIAKLVSEELREFPLIGPINEATFGATYLTLNYLRCLNKKPVTIMLYSFGGDICCGLAIYDLVRKTNRYLPVDIRATGACMSMGIVILQSARQRLATPHASFMLHQLHAINEGELGQLRDRHQHMEKTQKDLNAIIMQRSGITEHALSKLTERRDSYINAKEALKLNLIDKIVSD